MRERRCALLALLILAAASMWGCGAHPSGKAPSVSLGTSVCETCSMTLGDARFVAAFHKDGAVHPFDSIECLIRSRRASGDQEAEGIWLSDFDTKVLHPQGEMTLVHADFPSPMGGGYAAFADAAKARSEAQERHGELGTFEDALRGTLKGSAP